MTYYLSTTTSSSTMTNNITVPVNYITNGIVTSWPEAPVRPKTALEWLDGEIERTCALARTL